MRRPAGQHTRCVLLALVALASLGLVVSGPEHHRSESPPPTDPGWRNVGERQGRSAVYLGESWVLTAAHVGVGPVTFQDVTFPAVPDSAVTLKAHGASGRKTDLLLFRVEPAPELPTLGLRKAPMRSRTPLLMVGFGRGRGGRARWMNRVGYQYRPGVIKRWGTNQAQDPGVTIRDQSGSETLCFHTQFSRRGTVQEAQAAPGDSGGAVFARGAAHWKLAGLMLAVMGQRGQPKDFALYGDRTSIADLTRYRSQILALTGRKLRSREDRRSRRAAKRAAKTEAQKTGKTEAQETGKTETQKAGKADGR